MKRTGPRAADPRLKLSLALAALGLLLVIPRAVPSLALAGFALVALLSGSTDDLAADRTRRRRIPWGSLAAAWAFGALAATLRVFLTPGPALASWSFAGYTLEPSLPGLEQGALIFSRVLAATLTGAWLTTTTTFSELVAALGWMRVPAPFLEILLLANRYRHALAESLDTVRCAQAMRLGHEGWRRRMASTGALLGAVACRALDQAGATGEAMQLRGDRGLAALRLPERHPLADTLVAGGGTLVLICCTWLAWGASW